MGELYLRKARVTLSGQGGSTIINPGDETDDQIKIEFQVTRDMSGSASTAAITIYNLAKPTRDAMGQEFDTIELEAGYIPPSGATNVGTIFKGSIRDASHKREGNEIISKVECGDGDKAFRQATISKTYPKGTKVSTVVDDLAAEFGKYGMKRGEMKGLDRLPELKRPLSMCGACDREMDRIGRSNDMHWSSQNETLEIVPGDEMLGGILILTPDTGLIGTPELTDNGVKFDALLNPQARPGRGVIIQSDTLEMNSEGGLYRLGAVTFSGNNRDGEFKISGQAERTAGGKVDEGKRRSG